MRRALPLVLLALLAACNSDSGTASRAPAATPTATGGPVAARCGTDRLDEVRALRFAGPNGELQAVEAGTGATGLVLVHGGSPRGLCLWSAEVEGLVAAGYRVLAADHACAGESACPGGPLDLVGDVLAAARELRRLGATRVVVVGASSGTAQAIAAGAQPGVDAVVALSPTALDVAVRRPTDPAPRTAVDAASRLRVPTLLLTSDADAISPVAKARALARSAGSRVQLTVLPGGTHAQPLLHEPGAPDLGGAGWTRVRAFLQELSS